MYSAKKFEIIKNLRLATVIGVGAIGTLTTSFLVASGLRNAVAAQSTLSDLTAILLGCTALGLLLTALFCLLVFHAFSFFESTTLGQAIRLNEAMRLLHAKTNREGLDTLKFYNIPVFKAKTALGDDVEENVRCKLISTFLSPVFFRSDQNAAFGSDNHCCDYTTLLTKKSPITGGFSCEDMAHKFRLITDEYAESPAKEQRRASLPRQ